MNEVIDLMKNFNWQTIIAMFAIGWYFTKEIRQSLLKLETDVRDQGRRIDRLYEMFIDLLKERK